MERDSIWTIFLRNVADVKARVHVRASSLNRVQEQPLRTEVIARYNSKKVASKFGPSMNKVLWPSSRFTRDHHVIPFA